MKRLVIDDGQIIKLTLVDVPSIYRVRAEKVPLDADQCSAGIHNECNLHEHPEILECVVHETFRCNRCEKIHSWDFGMADDAPGLCDDCWAVYFGNNDAAPAQESP